MDIFAPRTMSAASATNFMYAPDFPYDSRKVPRTSKSALGPPDENKQASSSHQSIFKQIEELNGKKTKNRSKLDFKQVRKELRHTQ